MGSIKSMRLSPSVQAGLVAISSMVTNTDRFRSDEVSGSVSGGVLMALSDAEFIRKVGSYWTGKHTRNIWQITQIGRDYLARKL